MQKLAPIEIKQNEYPFRLNLYEIPPTDIIKIEEFEQYAMDRLSVLRSIENCRARNMNDEEMLSIVKKTEDKYMPLHSNQASIGFDLDSERKKDHISHFLLRLAFCLNETSQKWLISHETTLMKLRFLSENLKDKSQFISSRNLGYILENDVYKVPFEEVCDLVAKRAVELKDGFAYVHPNDSVSILINKFKRDLEMNLVFLKKMLPSLNEEERLVPLLKDLSNFDVDEDFSVKEGAIDALMVDKLASKFPPCMQKLHSRLQKDSHLKHGGRMQFGLFLKSIGLPMDQALIYWKRAFAKKYNDEQFQKNYAYNIRHNYGQEGKRVNYTPFSCHKIITNHPSAGDSHGCPFRHSETLLKDLNIDTNTGAEILELVKGRHYQIACTRYFELKNNLKKPIDTFLNPSQYFHAGNSETPANGKK